MFHHLGTTPVGAWFGITTQPHSEAPGNHWVETRIKNAMINSIQDWGEGGQKGPYYQFFPCNFSKLKKTLSDPFLWMGFNCLKAADPLLGNSLLFTTKSSEVSGTHLIDFGRMKG